MQIISVDKEYFNSSKISYINHYTFPGGLVSIIANKTLRLTDCMYLNDIEEYNYIFDVLDELEKDTKDKEIAETVSWVKKEIHDNNVDTVFVFNKNSRTIGMDEAKYYVLSGSKNNDELPMWNYYSKNGQYQGYCIKININTLAKEFSSLSGEFLYGRVIYNIVDQKNILESNIKKYLEIFNSSINALNKNSVNYSVDENRIIDDFQSNVLNLVNRTRMFFKNESFLHEKEYRIAILAPQDNTSKAFFTKNGIVIPAINLYMENNLPISSVIIGPTIDEKIAVAGLTSLFKNNGIANVENIKISKSKIKVRY